jgi:peptidoglycan LD-endopeptidase CwlK
MLSLLKYFSLGLIFMCVSAFANVDPALERLKYAYPDFINGMTNQFLIWKDGTKMPVGKLHEDMQTKLNTPSLADQVMGVHYDAGIPQDPAHYEPSGDPGRIRYLPFFKKMYGSTLPEVSNHLTTLFWMPKIFGKQYPLQVTTVNGVNLHLQNVSRQLEKLITQHPEYIQYVENPSTFNFRKVAGTDYLSPHGFGIAIDINPAIFTYWQYVLAAENKPIAENTPIPYQHSKMPWEIVKIFEENGFIWGGKWRHYDFMHFEYRPELLP